MDHSYEHEHSSLLMVVKNIWYEGKNVWQLSIILTNPDGGR